MIKISDEGHIHATGDDANGLFIALASDERLLTWRKEGTGSERFREMVQEAIAARGIAPVVGCHFDSDGNLIAGSKEGYWLCERCGLANDHCESCCDCGHQPSTRTFTPYPQAS